MSTIDQETSATAVPARTPEQRGLPATPEGAILRNTRVPYAPAILGVACVATYVWLLVGSRNFAPQADEWDFITQAGQWTFLDYFRPHNEHWSTIPAIVYKVLLETAGTGSYVPYMAVLLALHLAAAVLLYLIVRRRAGEVVALASTAMVLVLGQGAENLVWAFQSGFVGSVTFGLLAIYLLDPLAARPLSRGRAWCAAGSLVLSLACSGVGLFLFVTVAAMILLDRERRHLLWTLAPALGAYAVWYVTFGQRASEVHRSPLSIGAVEQLVGYVPAGIGAGLAGAVSMGPRWGTIALAAGTALFAVMLYQRRRGRALAVAAALGILAQFALTGLVRAQFGEGQATSSRYIYIAAFFLTLIFCEAAGELPWHGWWRPGILLVVATMVGHNAYTIAMAQSHNVRAADHTKAALQATWLLRDAPGLDHAAVPEPKRAPTLTADAYIESRSRYGSPYDEPNVAGLNALVAAGANEAVRRLLPLRAAITASSQDVGACELIAGDPADESPKIVTRIVGDGAMLTVSPGTTVTGRIGVGQWVVGPNFDSAFAERAVQPAQVMTVVLPVSGLNLQRHVAVSIPAGTSATVCIQPGP